MQQNPESRALLLEIAMEAGEMILWGLPVALISDGGARGGLGSGD